MRIGKFVKIKCSNCNKKVSVPILNLFLVSVFSQITGFAGLILFLSFVTGPLHLMKLSIVAMTGYIIGLMPAFIIYMNTTKLLAEESD